VVDEVITDKCLVLMGPTLRPFCFIRREERNNGYAIILIINFFLLLFRTVRTQIVARSPTIHLTVLGNLNFVHDLYTNLYLVPN
jgi:hypothetical protein